MFLVPYAPLFYADVGAPNVASRYEYADPANPTVGTNAVIAPTISPPTLDQSPASLWGWTQPAIDAVAALVVLPNGSVGTGAAADPDDPGVECGSELQLTRGDDYTGDRARSFFFESDTAPAATDVATMTWRDPYCDEVIGSVTTSSFSDAGEGRYCANFNLVNFAADNRPGQWPFDVEIAIDGADTRTIANGILDLIADQTR